MGGFVLWDIIYHCILWETYQMHSQSIVIDARTQRLLQQISK